MKIKILFLVGALGLSLLLQSNTYHIKLDGTGDFTTIQAGINASADTDTVLVYPDTYYENISYNGKNITVASLEIITGDEQYITDTIIDGQRIMSVVRIINEESDVCLRGLTITNGQGTEAFSYKGGGISINGEPDIIIECDIINCVIYKNYAFTGAGIFCWESDLYLSGTTIRDNYARTFCGGLYIGDESSVTFDPVNRCNIYNNYAATGLDILIIDEQIEPINVIVDTFTVQNPTRYFTQYSHEDPIPITFDILNHSLEQVNHDLYVDPEGDDSNSGLSPDEPMKTINLAIRKVVSDSLDPKTIHLARGSYFRSQQLFALGIKSHIKLDGAGMESTFIDGENEYGRLLYMGIYYENVEISNLSFRNAYSKEGALVLNFISSVELENINIFDCYSLNKGILHNMNLGKDLIFDNVNFYDNESEGFAGAASLYDTVNPIFRNCSFINNSVIGNTAYDAALRLDFAGSALIENCVFKNNYCENISTSLGVATLSVRRWNHEQGNIYIRNSIIENNIGIDSRVIMATYAQPPSKTYITNLTIVDNITEYTCSFANLTELDNTIIRNNSDYEIVLWDNSAFGYYYELTVNNCNILGGEDGIYNENNINFLFWEEGNIDEDPLFLNTGDDPYQLTEFSPCIDTGTPDTIGIFIPPWDLLGNQRIWDGDGNGVATIDMGAYEYGAEPYVSTNEPIIPDPSNSTINLNNYPNPFNPQTKISFNLPEAGRVQVEIYNIKGQKVRTLLDENKAIGRYGLIWYGKDNQGKSVSSGQYIVKLQQNDKETATKIMLLK